ncbi:MAG: hypothetical protein HYY51_02440 [Candidatus Magasanikbacteria bacterium]|nr:hypothetical protein [Candidatus Magasanikbacteria bacterium]
MQNETERQYERNRRSREVAERDFETREAKEEFGKELEAGAAMERADVLVREVKSSKKQVQNIMIHMQEVLKALKELREQLQLTQTEEDASVLQDKKRISDLQERISQYKDELKKMRGDLVREQINVLREQKRTDLSEVMLIKQAEEMVSAMMREVGLE